MNDQQIEQAIKAKKTLSIHRAWMKAANITSLAKGA